MSSNDGQNVLSAESGALPVGSLLRYLETTNKVSALWYKALLKDVDPGEVGAFRSEGDVLLSHLSTFLPGSDESFASALSGSSEGGQFFRSYLEDLSDEDIQAFVNRVESWAAEVEKDVWRFRWYFWFLPWKMVETAGYFLNAVWAGLYGGYVESQFEKCDRLKMEKQNPRAYHLANLFFVITTYTLPI